MITNQLFTKKLLLSTGIFAFHVSHLYIFPVQFMYFDRCQFSQESYKEVTYNVHKVLACQLKSGM